MSSSISNQQQSNNKSIDYLNFFFPSKRALYDILTDQKKYYLPIFESSCITEEYLLMVAKKQVFTLSISEVKLGDLRKVIFLFTYSLLILQNVTTTTGIELNYI